MTAERITCIIRKQQKHQHNTGSQETSMRNKSDDEAQSEHENDYKTKVELSMKMDEFKRGHRTFDVLIQDQDHLLAHMESELLKGQHRQRKRNIKTQRKYIIALQKDLKKYEKEITILDTEYRRSNEKSLKRTQNCQPSHPKSRQTTEQVHICRMNQKRKERKGGSKCSNVDMCSC